MTEEVSRNAKKDVPRGDVMAKTAIASQRSVPQNTTIGKQLSLAPLGSEPKDPADRFGIARVVDHPLVFIDFAMGALAPPHAVEEVRRDSIGQHFALDRGQSERLENSLDLVV